MGIITFHQVDNSSICRLNTIKIDLYCCVANRHIFERCVHKTNLFEISLWIIFFFFLTNERYPFDLSTKARKGLWFVYLKKIFVKLVVCSEQLNMFIVRNTSYTLLAFNVAVRETYLKQISNIGSVIAIARPGATKVEKHLKLNILYKMLLIPPNYSWTRGAASGQMVVRGFNYPLVVRHFTSHLFGYEINSFAERLQKTCFP